MEIKSNSTRLIVNTGAQYCRTIINLVLSLYSTRLILNALGLDDYGIFTLIGGIISMLAFITNAMVSTTQRFLSYHQSKSDINLQQQVFSNSILMHLGISCIVLILLEITGIFLFNGFLNIPIDRIYAAKIVYQCAIFMILISFMSAPFKALLISHENIVYTSIIEVCDGILKVIIAVILTIFGTDKLILYSILMLGIVLLDFIAFSFYDFRRYKECTFPRFSDFKKEYVYSMSSFIGWQLYSTGCIIGRTQGTALILNKFFGTIINASFGIALQMSAAISVISTALITAINPQIVKAEGGGDRDRMLRLAEVASKFSFLLLAMLVIPIIFKLDDIIFLWLGEVPKYSTLFCSVILVTSLIDQMTSGLGYANQAIGNIGMYSLTINTIKILTLPCITFLLYNGCPLGIAIWSYAFLELICALSRLPFLKHTGNLKIITFVNNVFFKVSFPFAFILIIYFIIYKFDIPLLLYMGSCIPITLIYILLIYKYSLSNEERCIIDSRLNVIIHKKRL